jgi:hypothetical protein
VKCSILYEGSGSRLTICRCYSWEIALNVGLDVSFKDLQEWKGIREKVWQVNRTKSYVADDESYR